MKSKEREISNNTRGRQSRWMQELNIKLWNDESWQERRAWVRIKVLPLYLRGGSMEEIAQTTGFTNEQVQYTIGNLRTSKPPQLPRPTKAEEHLARTKAVKDSWRKRKGIEYTEEEQKSHIFARMLVKADLFTKDLAYWEKLHVLYQTYRRQLPENFADLLRLEVFLRAREALGSDDSSSLVKYNDVGGSIDEKWFDASLAPEEEFITMVLETGYGINQKGVLFDIDAEGRAWTPIDIENEQLVVVTSDLLRSRERTRMWRSPIPAKNQSKK